MQNNNVHKNFFSAFQKRNTIKLLKDTINKIINQWLNSDDDRPIKLQNLQQLAQMESSSDTLSDVLPDFVKRLWSDPHQTFTALDCTITIVDIRNVIKETAKEKIDSEKSNHNVFK